MDPNADTYRMVEDGIEEEREEEGKGGERIWRGR